MKSFSTRGNQPPGARDEQGRGGEGEGQFCVFRLLSATISWRGAESGVNADERRVDIFSSFIYHLHQIFPPRSTRIENICHLDKIERCKIALHWQRILTSGDRRADWCNWGLWFISVS